MLSWPDIFQFDSFFECCSVQFALYCHVKASWCLCKSFSMLLISSAFMLCYFCSYILLQNSFASFAFSCSYVLLHYPPTYLWNFLSLFLNVLFWLSCLSLSVLLKTLLLPTFFDLSLQVTLFDLSAVLFYSFYLNSLLHFFLLPLYLCLLSYCPSNLIFNPDFVFLFGFLRGTPILSQTKFSPA